jgi:nitrogen regulatory protein PII
MYFVLFVLSDTSKCDDLLYGWENAGVKGITLLASSGLGRIRQKMGLLEDFPIFPSLSEISEHSEKLSRTFFTIAKNDEMVDKIVKNTQEVVGDLSQPNTGILIVLPVAKVYGLDKKENNY